ncbi:MAG: VapC toxin family PIN domain ribonuclease [Acidobacteria bacterium]|nr:VapC toxin family PIN domain ribonuclease [Acidobacteriota bacterium]
MDTSVWIHFFYNKAPAAAEMDHLLASELVVSHDLIYGELMIGETGGGRSKFLTYIDSLPKATSLPHDEVVKFVRDHSLQPQGAGWIDIHLLVSAVTNRMQFWTVDPRLQALAQHFKVAYTFPSQH